MKSKLLVPLIFFVGCAGAHAGLLKLGSLIGATLLGKTAYDKFQIEKNNNRPVSSSLGIAAKTKELVLPLAEKLDSKNDKYWSTLVKKYGESAEDFEVRRPETAKFSALSLAFIVSFIICAILGL